MGICVCVLTVMGWWKFFFIGKKCFCYIYIYIIYIYIYIYIYISGGCAHV